MSHILTLQSHVVFGYAGNAAAAFPIQRLGHQASSLNLLQFSNHTGYGQWGGKVLSVSELNEIFSGLENIHATDQIDAIITGYIGSEEQVMAISEFIQTAKKNHPNLVYCCDPVIGDEHTGMYVKPEVAKCIKQQLMSIADIITPNKYELSIHTGTTLTNVASVRTACQEFINNGTKVLATSIATKDNQTGMLFCDEKQTLHIEMPRYDVAYTVRGTGDVTTAIFLCHYLSDHNCRLALEKTANTMHEIVKFTHQNHLPELAIIQCQEAIANPMLVYKALVQ